MYNKCTIHTVGHLLPKDASHALPTISNWPIDLFLPASFTSKAEYVAMLTYVVDGFRMIIYIEEMIKNQTSFNQININYVFR